MKDKVVLVTGANGGLGTHVTQAFLDEGATVVGTSRRIQQSDFNNSNFTAIAGEISTREGAKVLVDQVTARFGKLDVLAHTIEGFAGGQSIADTDDATFQRMFDLNRFLLVSCCGCSSRAKMTGDFTWWPARALKLISRS